MNHDDRDLPDPVLEKLLARDTQHPTPSDGFTERVLGALRRRSLVRTESSGARRMLVAASWFLAGVGVGAASHFALTREAGTQAAVVAADAAAGPEVWY